MQQFRNSKTTFSKPPIFNVGESLGRSKSGRLTYARNSAKENLRQSKPSLKAKVQPLRAKVQPSRPTNTSNVELLELKLKARGRGTLNNKFRLRILGPVGTEAMKSLRDNAKNTFYFQNKNDNTLKNTVLGISRV